MTKKPLENSEIFHATPKKVSDSSVSPKKVNACFIPSYGYFMGAYLIAS